jgi:hypothetical protein
VPIEHHPTCNFRLSNQLSEKQRRNAYLLSRPNRCCVHEDFPKEAVAQMPKVARPNAFERRVIHELAKHGIDAVAPSSNAETSLGPRILAAAKEG